MSDNYALPVPGPETVPSGPPPPPTEPPAPPLEPTGPVPGVASTYELYECELADGDGGRVREIDLIERAIEMGCLDLKLETPVNFWT